MKKMIKMLLVLLVSTFMLSSVYVVSFSDNTDDPLLMYYIAYRDAVVNAGSSASEIESANQAIANRQAALGMPQTEVGVTKMSKKEAQAVLDTVAGNTLATSAGASGTSATTTAASSAVTAPVVNTQAALATTTALTTTPASAIEKGSKKQTIGVIFVGDSRCVQMKEAMGETGVTTIAENSKGYDWFVENAIPRIDPLVTKGTTIVINLGVNDLGNIDKYLSKVNAKAAEWEAKGATVYYATVNPVWENPYSTEEGVKAFNSKLVSGLAGVDIIDTHTFLVTNGYKLVDGLHYDGPTYANIYYYILSQI